MVGLQEQELERRHRDRDQDDHRHQRPGHFEQGVVRGARRRRIGLGVELDDDDDQQRQHEQRDQRDDQPEQEVVEPVDVIHHRRDGVLKAELPGRRLPGTGPRHVA